MFFERLNGKCRLNHRITLVGVMISVILLAGCTRKDKPRISRKCFPVPITCGDEKVISSLYIELDFIEYNMPFAEFACTAETEEEKFICEALQMIAAGDIEKANEIVVPDSSIARDSWLSGGPEKYLSMMGMSFKSLEISDDLSNVTIGSIFHWRNLCIVTYASDIHEVGRISTIFFERQDEKLVIPMAFSNVSSLVREIAVQAYNNSDMSFSREKIVFEYSFTFDQEDTDHQATLLFKGKQYDTVIPGDHIKSDDETAYFYQQFISDIKKSSTPEDISNLADYFDEYGRNKFLGWLDKEYGKTIGLLDEIARREIHIKFIIDANPVYLIYITPSHCALTTEGHDYVLKKGDGFQIARLAYGDNLSQIMGGKEFKKPFLISLSKSNTDHKKGDAL